MCRIFSSFLISVDESIPLAQAAYISVLAVAEVDHEWGQMW